MNRRVEIVILPEFTKTKETKAQVKEPDLKEPLENLK